MKVVALAGGVGGAKLADGLASVLPPGDLTVIVNTGDDFDHFGLRICTDLDTVCYTLAGLANPETSWGRRDETWTIMQNLKKLAAPDWFHLGDKDIATHLERTRLLNSGWSLSQVVSHFCNCWGISQSVHPMTDDLVATRILTADGQLLDFQDYFVHQQWQPVVHAIQFDGINTARPAAGIMERLEMADLVVICPSNPLVSIDPILNVNGIREAILKKCVVAVSPILGGKAVKGPLAKMIRELYNVEPSADWVAGYYQNTLRLDGYMIDQVDASLMEKINRQGIICKPGLTLMSTKLDRTNLAQVVLSFGQTILRRNVLP